MADKEESEVVDIPHPIRVEHVLAAKTAVLDALVDGNGGINADEMIATIALILTDMLEATDIREGDLIGRVIDTMQNYRLETMRI